MDKVKYLLEEILEGETQDFIKPADALIAVNGSPSAGQFRSEIQGRSDIPDLSNDLALRFGPKRIMTQSLDRRLDETGVSGQQIFGVDHDSFNQIRFGGRGWEVNTDAKGLALGLQSGEESDPINFIEIVFYGTDLMILDNPRSGIAFFDREIDGASSGQIDLGGVDIVLDDRDYNINRELVVASGLSLGFHTVRLSAVSGNNNRISIYGFEIYNNRTDLLVNPGTSIHNFERSIKSSSEAIALTSDFETGAITTRGGNCLVYRKSNGDVKKAVNPTDALSGFLAGASHINETLKRQYDYREFGSGRSDDWSNTGSAITPGFHLADSRTGLFSNGTINNFSAGDLETSLGANNGNDFTFAFYGSGLDVEVDTFGGTLAGTIEILVDGVSKFSGTSSTLFTESGFFKIASGLPLGDHTAQFKNTGAGTTPFYNNFKVYVPSLPQLPDNAVKLGSYFINSDYIENLPTLQADRNISQGILRNHPSREGTFTGSGSWAQDLVNGTYPLGAELSNNSSGAVFEFSFFGTGVELYEWNTGHAHTVALDDGSGFQTLTSGNFPGIVTGGDSAGGSTFTEGTGVWATTLGNTASGIFIRNLPLNLYRIRVTSTTRVDMTGWAVITPIYSPQETKPAIFQNEGVVGNTALIDDRKFSLIKADEKVPPNYSQAVGFISDISTSVTVFIAVPDMKVLIRTKGNPIEISAILGAVNGTNGAVFTVSVDGKLLDDIDTASWMEGADRNPTPYQRIVKVSAGFHFIQMYWRTISGGSTTSEDNARHLMVRELK